MNEPTKAAPDTPEMKAFAAFLAGALDQGMNGHAMRDAIKWSLGQPADRIRAQMRATADYCKRPDIERSACEWPDCGRDICRHAIDAQTRAEPGEPP